MFVKSVASIFSESKHLLQFRAIPYLLPKFCHHEAIKQSTSNETMDNQCDTHEHKLLKVAVVGMPNVGKSTLVNQLVKRRVRI